MKENPSLIELIELSRRVEASKEVDEMLNRDICKILHDCLSRDQPLPASLDAAIGLLLRQMPERTEVRLRIASDHTDAAIVSDPFAEGTQFGFGRTPVLALISALLRGLISESEKRSESASSRNP